MQWFFVPDGTPYLPFGTIFTSNEWLDEPEGDVEVGEVPGATRVWVDGTPPFPVTGQGPPCGTQDDFALGGLIGNAGAALNVYGGLACCPVPPAPFVHFACVNCEDGAASDYTVGIHGISPAIPLFQINGNWRLRYMGSCTWQSDHIPATIPPDPTMWYQIVLTRQSGRWQIQVFSNNGFENVTYAGDAVSCLVLVQLGRITVPAPITNFPPFITIVPGISTRTGPFCPASGQFMVQGYDLIVPDVPARNVAKLLPGYYPMSPLRPCVWSGEIPVALRGIVGQLFRGGMMFTMTLAADLSATVLVTPQFLTLTRGVATFQTAPGWDQLSTVAAMLQPGFFGPFLWPNALQIYWPGVL